MFVHTTLLLLGAIWNCLAQVVQNLSQNYFQKNANAPPNHRKRIAPHTFRAKFVR